MSGIDLYRIWAPESSPWSLWAKPVLFNYTSNVGPAPSPTWPDSPLRAQPDTALVLELPGERSVAAAIALAKNGWRPVPLFNCVPGPRATVPWEPLIHQLALASDELSRISIPDDAPPVFLLDARRMRPTLSPVPGTFDNRWVVFPQDFPSGGFLKSRGINSVIVLSDGLLLQAPNDLAHVLVRWKTAGLDISAASIDNPSSRAPMAVRRPSIFGSLFYRIGVALGLRRNSAGGFGGIVPQPSSGGA